MEKLAWYLFASGFITVGLAFLSFAVDAIGGLLRVRQVGLATESGGGTQVSGSPIFEGVGRYGVMLGWLGALTLTLSIVARTQASGRGPFSNMYDYSIAFAWGITIIYMLIHSRYQSRALGLVVLPVALGLMTYAASLPSAIDPLVPALQHSTLLTMHVSVAILAYSCFAISFGAATLFLVQDRLRSRYLPDLDALDEVGFLSAGLGFPFMTLVLVLGAYWANIAWGRYWGWDPKETASLITWLIYTGYLHTRALRDWRGRRSAALLVVGFAAVMLTYFGNLFFAGLHAYG